MNRSYLCSAKDSRYAFFGMQGNAFRIPVDSRDDNQVIDLLHLADFSD